MPKRIAAAAALLVLFGLLADPAWAVSQKSRAKYLRENPGLSYKVKRAIMSGEILVGMTERDVVAAIGRPYDINRSVYGEGRETAQFVYEDSPSRYSKKKYKYVYFENHLVTSWQT
jgi:hypothetical protein